MSKMKMGMGVIALTMFLAGCSEKPEKVILPDKEPNEVVQEAPEKGTPEQPVPLVMTEIVAWYEDDKTLRDYKEDMSVRGYVEPYKEMVLAENNTLTKKGLLYEVEDGFVMFEYDDFSKEVLAITGYQTVLELEIQEMKTKTYAKENELSAETDEAKKASLQAEIDAMWTEIGELENN